MPFSLCEVMLRDTDSPQGPRNLKPPFPRLPGQVATAVHHRGVTLHAVADSHKIKAAFDRVAQVGVRRRLFGAGRDVPLQRRLVDRRRTSLRTGGTESGYSDHCIEIARRENLVEGIGHDGCEPRAAWTHAVLNGAPRLRRAPFSDPGLEIGRDVGSLHRESGFIPGLRPAGIEPGGIDRSRRPVRAANGSSRRSECPRRGIARARRTLAAWAADKLTDHARRMQARVMCGTLRCFSMMMLLCNVEGAGLKPAPTPACADWRGIWPVWQAHR